MNFFIRPRIAALLVCFFLPFAPACIKWRAAPSFQNPTLDLAGAPAAPLEVGFASEKITPAGPVWMAGFGAGRRSLGVHDDLFVRVLVLRQGQVKILLAVFDLIGLQGDQMAAIKAAVPGFAPEQMIVACTHTHSGPDVMGLWGPVEMTSGIDPAYIRLLGRKLASAAAAAEASLRPAAVSSAVYKMAPEIMFNANLGEPEDETMGLMVFRALDGATIATLVNAAGHPETMWGNNRCLTSDYPGRVCALIEEKLGGGAIFFNGALGAMITPNLPQSREGRGWETLERVSQSVFAEVQRGLTLLEEEKNPSLRLRRATILCPVKNARFTLGAALGILKREVYPGMELGLSVSVLEIGGVQAVTFPGEAYPKLGLKVRAMQKPKSFQFGLADDEVGYIIYPGDAKLDLYNYETSVCVNPELSVMIENTLAALLAE